MPKKIKVVDVEASPNVEDNVKVTESNIDEVVVNVDVPETVQPVEPIVKNQEPQELKRMSLKMLLMICLRLKLCLKLLKLLKLKLLKRRQIIFKICRTC